MSPSDTPRGILYKLANSLCFTLISIISKLAAPELRGIQVFCLGAIAGFFFFMGVGLVTRQKIVLPSWRNCKFYVGRAFLGALAMNLWFISLGMIPVVQAAAIGYITPIITTFYALILLRERYSLPTIMGLMIGFAGAMIVVRPTIDSMSLGIVLAFSTTFIWATSDTLVKLQTTGGDSPFMQALWMLGLHSVFTLPFACYHWQPLTGHAMIWVGLMAVLLMTNLIMLYQSYRYTDLHLVMPFHFSRLLFLALFSYLFFGENMDEYSLLGASIIFASSIFLMHHAKKRARMESPIMQHESA
jgi:drug/metabolite transporter (DMT)-like permease